MEKNPVIEYFIEKERQGTYFTLPFEMPPDVEKFSLTYSYLRHDGSEARIENGRFTSRQEVNIIDLGLISPDGTQVGASGSDKTEIEISETFATPGYTSCLLKPGSWQILVGAYKVAPAGVAVRYQLGFTFKHMRLLKGDLHVHTLASDGVLSVEELACHAQRNGLDFLAITDHNQMVPAASLPRVADLTLIPGVEWTHYQGHANFLGVDQPYAEPFATHSAGEALERFKSARQAGALISVNHPFDEQCPFTFDLQAFPFDCLEVWNGPMRESNLRALGLWHAMLMAGRKVPICGGSDYHRDSLFIFPGGPTTCVHALSRSPADILAGLKAGHAYITFAPNGPHLEMTAGEALPGDSLPFAGNPELQLSVSGLLRGDVVQVVSRKGSTPLLTCASDGRLEAVFTLPEPGFARVEVLRVFVPGLPPLPALVSNPIYFEA